MAALALASSEADDVFEAVAATSAPAAVFESAHGPRPARRPGPENAALRGLRGHRRRARAARRRADAAALLAVLGAPVDEETTARDIQESDRGTIVASLHWCLRDRAAHKKRIYDARLALPIRAVAAAARREKLRAPRR